MNTNHHNRLNSLLRAPLMACLLAVIGLGPLFVAARTAAADLPMKPIFQAANLKPVFGDRADYFGYAVAISGDTAVIGAYQEDSGATGINGDESDGSALDSGAAYVFVREGTNWVQQAYLKASNTGEGDGFGLSVGISGDTIAVGAYGEDSNATGVNGDQSNNAAEDSGAAYVFLRTGTNWTQQAYLKAVNTGGAANGESGDYFGFPLAISGETIVVGAYNEDSDAPGVNGDPENNRGLDSGAAYVFIRSGTNWSQQAFLKASNDPRYQAYYFGHGIAISGDTIVAGAYCEDSDATGVNGDPNNVWAICSGAAYVFVRSGTNWTQQAYLKASNTGRQDFFGDSVAVSGDTVVIGADGEASNATGVNGNQSDNSIPGAGAAYVFVRDGTNWTQQAYLKPPNTNSSRQFGFSVAVSGTPLAVGAFSGDLGGLANPVGEAHVFSGLGHGPRLDLFPDGAAGYRVRLKGAPEAAYCLQRALDPAGSWETVATLTTPASGCIDYHDASPPARASFYRTVQP